VPPGANMCLGGAEDMAALLGARVAS
jgi:hypothetical protein